MIMNSFFLGGGFNCKSDCVFHELALGSVGNFDRFFFLFCSVTNKCKLFKKLSHSYTFRHYRVILRQLVINTLPSYTSISNAAVRNTIYN